MPTIYDVAKAAGVSASTVSRTFSRPGRVNAQTAERVRQAANDLGYRTNPQARALSTTRAQMLAVVLADVTNPGFFDLIRGAAAGADARDYTIMVAETRESADTERDVLQRAAASVDGIVLAGSRMSDGAIRQIAKVAPLVMVNRDVSGVPSVVIDFAKGARLTIEHLAGLGHRQLTYLSGPEASWPDGMRWRSLRDAGTDEGVHVRRLGPFAPTLAGGVQAATRWLEGGGSRAARARESAQGTAVVAYNDVMAIGFIRAVQNAGVRVPSEVSVIGADNSTSAEIISPGLTTVAAPLYDVGHTAASNVLALIGGAHSRRGGPVVVPTKLVVRESTAHA